ncbi:glycosyltransferase [Candidatus Thioglobus sp.]|nr:glycosyltransferase [Candidatus Thioglobus sp.]
MLKTNNFSVVMSVYNGDIPQFLKEAYISVIEQSLVPSEIVIIVDGPVGASLKEEIKRIATNKIVNCIWLEVNMGRGAARDIGILNAKNTIIALMDADDVSDHRRFEEQFSVMKNSDYDVIGGYISEFKSYPEESFLIRKVPLFHSEIVKRGKFIQPMNHVTIMFNKYIYTKVGGYKNLKFIEDYDLIYRLISIGAKFTNIPKILVNVRVSNDQYHRRKGINYFLEEVKLQNEMYRSKYISLFILIRNLLIRLIIRFLPTFIFKFITKNFLRKSV